MSVERHTWQFFDDTTEAGNATRVQWAGESAYYNSHQNGFTWADFNYSKGYFATGDSFYVGCKTGYEIQEGAGRAEAAMTPSIRVSNNQDALA